MLKIKLLILFFLAWGSAHLYSQELHSSLQIRNSNLWRGLELATGLLYTAALKQDYKQVYGAFCSSLAASARLGYSFTFRNRVGDARNFLAKKAGFNAVSLLPTKIFEVGEYKFPLEMWAMCNPVNNNAYLQFSVQVFSF